ncbi:MAG: hypothetical protein NT075_36990 [Chloroflexi bacterium]|nr:hypothetical protein [Chloroflexota bacterium]
MSEVEVEVDVMQSCIRLRIYYRHAGLAQRCKKQRQKIASLDGQDNGCLVAFSVGDRKDGLQTCHRSSENIRNQLQLNYFSEMCIR